MKWHGYSGFKVYASASIALIGLSAASTLLTERTSLAQQPPASGTIQATVTVDEDDAMTKLEQAEKQLAETLGNDHPQLKILRSQLDQLRTRVHKAAQAAGKAEAARRVAVQSFGGLPGALAEVSTTDGDVLTENILGNQTVVVRRTADGQELREVHASGPMEVRAFSMLGHPKLNPELQKAFETFKSKDASESDKAEAKEKIVAILGQQFDEDMQQRSQQIADLEKKVVTLKEQIEKRKGAKSRMIELRLEMLLNESEGLGFPSSWQQPATVAPISGHLFPAKESRTVVRALGLPVPPVPPAPPAASAPPAPPAPK